MGKSWSGLKKELEEEFLCESLRGRVHYFLTHYRYAHDDYGRFCVRVDKNEYAKANPFAYYVKGYYKLECRTKVELDVPDREWTGDGYLYEEENKVIEDKFIEMSINNGDFDICDVTEAIREYKGLPIEKSIASENPIIRMFAIMDRRIGKRTLRKLADQVDIQPEWLQFFYKLRLDSEKINREKYSSHIVFKQQID